MALESPEPVENIPLREEENEVSETVWVCEGCTPVETQVLTALTKGRVSTTGRLSLY